MPRHRTVVSSLPLRSVGFHQRKQQPGAKQLQQALLATRARLQAIQKHNQEIQHTMNAAYFDVTSAIYMLLLDLQEGGVSASLLDPGRLVIDRIIMERQQRIKKASTLPL